MPLHLQIVTPEGAAIDEEVAEVLVPTESGTIGVLPRHTDLTSVTKLGIVGVRRNRSDADSDMDHFVVTPGIAEIGKDHVRILVDIAEHAASIDEFHAQQELQAAQEKLRATQDRTEAAAVQAAVEHHALRVDAARRR